MARLTIRIADDLASAVDRVPSSIELAGLVMHVRQPAGPAPSPAALARARRAAGRGRPLSEYVLDGRR